jgi:predicted SAM-dependent methyltransferase
MTRVNIGCGQSPTPGWRNYDNSLSVRLARRPLLAGLCERAGLIGRNQREFIAFAKAHRIEWADSTKHIPLPAGSVEVLYSSHMVEHLDSEEARSFLAEARRVLKPGGVIRLALPDLRKLVDYYQATGDADEFLHRTYLCHRKPKSLVERLKQALVGNREHYWMYDAASLTKLLASAGFVNVRVLPAGRTHIADPGGLDLYERDDESVYVEANNPEPPAAAGFGDSL